jgi:ferric-dicitrate binding protein FerR (iron transport regulator)
MNQPNYTVEDLICDVSFQHYCLGDDPQAVQTWTAWINNNPDMAPLAEEAKHIISILNANQGNLQEQVDQLKDGINRFDLLKQALQQEPAVQPVPTAQSALVRFKRVGVAAAVLVLVLAGYFLFRPTTSHPPKEQVASVPQPPTILSSGSEPRKTVVLPDGSVVTLRSKSSITLAQNFNTAHRELSLSGEAFFDVTHQQGHPFIVHTNEVNIEVLGTAFNVSARSNAHTETALFRGKVAVSVKGHPEQKVILTPNMKLIYMSEVQAKASTSKEDPFRIVPMTVDPSNHKAKEIAWIRNRLKIEDEPLSAIAAKLQQWYGIEITFADETVKTYRYSGTFESETVVKAFEALQLSYPFNFQVEKEKIIISK